MCEIFTIIFVRLEICLVRSSHHRHSIKKGFLEIIQNSRENTCTRVSGLRPATLLKKRLCHRCFPVNFVKFLTSPFSQNTSVRVILSGVLHDIIFRLDFFYSFELTAMLCFKPLVYPKEQCMLV